MNRAALSIGIGLLAGTALAAAFLYGPRLGFAVTPQVLSISGSAIAVGCTIALVLFMAMNRPSEKPTASKLFSRKLSEIENLIDYFPTKENGKELFIRPETSAADLDPVKNPDRYRSKSIILRLRGAAKGSDPFNPVKLREIFGGLAFRPNFEHVVLYDENREFVGYIPAWYARSAFVSADAEARIARAITDIYSGSMSQANLRDVRGATTVDVISDHAKLSEAMDRFAGGFTLLVVLKDHKHREPIGFLRSERVFEAIKNNGLLERPGSAFAEDGGLATDMRG